MSIGENGLPVLVYLGETDNFRVGTMGKNKGVLTSAAA